VAALLSLNNNRRGSSS